MVQDAQFRIGNSSKVSAALWYPVDGKPWHGSAHYSISCDWISLDIMAGTGSSSSKAVEEAGRRSPWDAATAFSLLFSVVAFCLSVFIGHRVSRSKGGVPFTPMDNLWDRQAANHTFLHYVISHLSWNYKPSRSVVYWVLDYNNLFTIYYLQRLLLLLVCHCMEWWLDASGQLKKKDLE